ncbi:MAG TPA: SDR family NAD(P)-dependent oxidoreductase [Chloroflexota bacterium]
MTTSTYWRQQVRQPVRFGKGVQTAIDQGCQVLLEVGPGATLVGLGRRMLADAPELTWLTSLRAERDEWQQVLESVGGLYVRGVTPDWTALEHGQPPRWRVRLPTYPFQPSRYWVQPARETIPRRGDRLPGQRVHSPLFGDASVFETTLDAQWPPLMSEHRIRGAIVAPASVYLVMAVAAAESAGQVSPVTLTDVEFAQPLVVEQADSRLVQLAIDAQAQGETSARSIHLYSRSSTTQNRPSEPAWTLHFRARLTAAGDDIAGTAARRRSTRTRQRANAPTRQRANVPDSDACAPGSNPRHSFADALVRCPSELASEAFYRLALDHDIAFGPSFRWLEHIWRRDGEALAQLRLPSATDDTDAYPIHPGVLDACFQLVAVAAPATAAGLAAVPARIERIRIFDRPTGRLWCHAQLRPEATAPDDTATTVADIGLFDADDRLIAEIVGVTLRSVPLPRARSSAVGEWLYEVEWQSSELAQSSERSASADGEWLILADAGGTGSALARQLEKRGGRCVLVEQNGNALPLDRAWRGIIHLWSLDAPPVAQPGLAALNLAAQAGCGSALTLVQALARTRTPARLWLVTRGAVAVDDSRIGAGVTQAPLWGFGRTLAFEHPELAGGLIDLDPVGPTPEVDAECLLAHIDLADGESQVAFRGGQRYLARLARSDPQPADDTRAEIHADATYLISGGFGALGLAVAEWLVERGARHLLLMGRSRPSPAAQAVVDKLQAVGVRVIAAQADVSREADVATTLQQMERPLRGVIHAAGVLDDGLVLSLDWSRFAAVLAPKVAGAWNLHVHTRDAPLDFFVMFSSLAGVIGSPGQVSYAAANTFLDALAQYRRAAGLPALSVDWGPWTGDGMARGTILQQASIEQQQALVILEHLLSGAAAQVAVLPTGWERLLDAMPTALRPRLLAAIDAAVPPPEMGQASDLTRAIASAPASRRHELIRSHVRGQVVEVLGLDTSQPLDPRQGLWELGMDSLLALELRNRLQASLGLELPATVVFEHPTVADLADHLEHRLRAPEVEAEAALESDSDDPELAALVDEIEQLSDAELDLELAILAESPRAAGGAGGD